MSRMRVLVCGSNYGRAYITALARNPRRYQLAGILAQGSARSLQVAAANTVPLYLSTDKLPDNIDFACAAMSSAAWPVVLQLIRRGIHVLCEHPYPAGTLKKALALARKHGVQFHVNGHFANLPAPQSFIRECRLTSKLARPQFVEVLATDRSLYGALDILISALGSRQPVEVSVLSRRAKFVLLEGTLGKIPLRMAVQVSGKKGTDRLVDGSPGYLIDQRLTAGFSTGLLTLLSMSGPVIWNSISPQVRGTDTPLWTVICDQQPQTVAALREQRIRANIEALNSIRRCILRHERPEIQQPQHVLQISKAWESIGGQLYSG